jgi:Zn finger protein HypA/HybF involved in hydrogenase expression
MHELAICHSLLRQGEEIARRERAQRVDLIRLRIGPLSGVVALQAWRALSPGAEAAIVGAVTEGRPQLELVTGLGGARILEELEDDPLPRTC